MGRKIDSFAELKVLFLEKSAKPHPSQPTLAKAADPQGARIQALESSSDHFHKDPKPKQFARKQAEATRPNPSSSRPMKPSLASIYRPDRSSDRKSSPNKLKDGTTHISRTECRIAAAGALRIASTDPVPLSSLIAAMESHEPHGADSDVAIIGLDFGTAFIKVAVSWMGDRGIVDWGKDDQGKSLFWVPSTFHRGQHGAQLGNRADAGDVNAIKLRLIATGLSAVEAESAVVDAITYLSLVLRHVIGWTQRWVTDRGGAVSNFILNVGFPAESVQNRSLSGRYHTVVRRAWDSVTESACLPETWRAPQIHVIPEFAAQLYGYLKDPHRARDSHLLIDIGAGTADFVAFIPHVEKGRNRTPILSSKVRALGIHKLLAARVGSAGRKQRWLEGDALLEDAVLAMRTGEALDETIRATSDFIATLSSNISTLISGARSNNPLCRNLQQGGTIPTFLTGGGGDAGLFKAAVANADSRIRPRPLPVPEGLQWSGASSAFHRVSVAYGLSFSRRSLGEILNTADLERIEPVHTRKVVDRDESR